MIRIMFVMLIILANIRNAQGQTSTFSMSFDSFRIALDDKIRQDTLDKNHINDSTISKCLKVEDTYYYSFHDIGFNKSLEKFKDLGVVHGNFKQKLDLVVSTYGGKVSRIALISDRADPMNLFQFEATIENIMQIFDPNAVQGEGAHKRNAEEIGSLRGNSAPDIGDVRSVTKYYATIGCLSKKSDISTQVECQIVPR